MPSSEIKIILGTNEFGKRLNSENSELMVKTFYDFRKNSKPVELDTAHFYGGGKSEEYIGKINSTLKDNIQIATKANPLQNKSLNAASVKNQLETSLKRMKLDCIQIFYLHVPDHETPIFETLKAVNDLYQEKKFKEFGLSNYAAWQVAEICTICENQGWIQPTVYQGMYNCLTRSVEKELFPCLCHFNIRFYAYNPLCGGLLTGKHTSNDSDGKLHRFSDKVVGEVYRKRYWNKEIFSAVEKITQKLLDFYGTKVSIAEASIRWLLHHSKLDASSRDGVILGASNVNHIKFNLDCTTKGPLDDEVVLVIDECWNDCCKVCSDYWR